ncbi:MAG TPA: hypothetical protein DCY88_14235, partial [Cyanobacteria bacterium UBA11372]|nr:hypothetical protein [Cyanobacteria bacterium UBA11372]
LTNNLTTPTENLNKPAPTGENYQLPITNYQLPITNIEANLNNLPPSRAAVYARINLAQSLIRLKQQNYPNARSELEIAQVLVAAIQQAKSLQDQQATSYALGIMGELYEVAQQRENAQEVTQQALFIAQKIDAKDIAYRWQWQMGRLLKQEGNIKGAIAAYTEAVNNLKSIRRDLSAVNPDVQFNFRDEVEPVYRQLVDLLLQSEPSQENLLQARNLIESLQLAELENFFRASCLDANPELIDKIVDKEDKAAAVIYPIILSDRIEVILKLPTQEKLRHYVADKSAVEVETLLEQLRKSLLDVTQTTQVKRQSQQLYDWLIRPIEAELANSKIKTLAFVLDGSLRNIPMAVLYDKQQQKYLVEKYAIAVAPGLQLLQPKPLRSQPLRALMGGIAEGREIEGRKFPPLGNVSLELERIQSEVTNSEELLNQTFTVSNLQNQLNSTNFSVVHIATHGEFSSNPEETFILTWNQLLKARDFDNLLRASNNQNLSNTIELLVLSACKTAQGDKRAALGLAGIAVRAGARSTLATLWSVDDQYATELISRFYQELKSGANKAEALQRAQLAVFANEKRPYFWASYVLIGNWL